MKQIQVVKFVDNIQVGPDSHVHSYMQNNTIYGGHRVLIELDREDDRFVRLTGTHVDRPTDQYLQWIPLTQVTSILFKEIEDGKPVLAQGTKK